MLKYLENKIMSRSIIFTLSLFAGSALCAQEIATDRPDQTESSAVVPGGSLQIESGIQVSFEGAEGLRQLLAPTTLFRYAPVDKFEIRVVSQFESLKTEYGSDAFNGIGDLEVGTKVQLLQKEYVNAEIALLSHVIVPIGTFNEERDDVGVVNKLCVSHQLGSNIELGYNLGYDILPDENQFTYSVALGVGVNDKVGIYIEPFGAVSEEGCHASSFDAGFTYLVRDNVQLDFSFGTGINYNMNYLAIGASWRMDADRD